MIKLCVAGATGRMGRTLIAEALKKGFNVVGAIAAPEDKGLGKTLRELEICNLDLIVADPSEIKREIKQADVYVSFTTPKAELANLPLVVEAGKRIVMGTTGFSGEELNWLKEIVSKRVPAVFSFNFSVGINFLLKILKTFKALPEDYDVSILEAHHAGKKDAPSGTANYMAKLLSDIKGFKTIVYGRRGLSSRRPDEIEVLSARAGGIPGVHRVLVAGAYEMITIEHVAFSRNVFAQGALKAVEWIVKQTKPGVYSMEDVLGVDFT